MCSKHYGSFDVILGTADHLLVLKRILEESDAILISRQDGCTVEVTYRNEDGIYIWSAVIDGEFNIIKRGQKQGLIHPDYLNPKATHSRADLLHNYENVIALTPS